MDGIFLEPWLPPGEPDLARLAMVAADAAGVRDLRAWPELRKGGMGFGLLPCLAWPWSGEAASAVDFRLDHGAMCLMGVTALAAWLTRGFRHRGWALNRRDHRKLAVIDGRRVQGVSNSECEEARRELTGEADADPKEAALESAPESERWDPVPGSTGHKVPVAAGEDEDDEGRSDKERLVEEGIAGAEHDQMLQATGGAAT